MRSLESMRNRSHNPQRGQTIIVALIVLGLLLILGLVFLGIINNSIQGSARQQTRSVANDLAEAGVRYAHSQLLRSPEGADWRGATTPPTPVNGQPNLTRDPDAIYTRLASGFSLTNGQFDRGGPDGLGPFVRINFESGRALVRVRYAPSDANIFTANPAGSLRSPGAVRNYLVIESVGRSGRYLDNDPTSAQAGTAIQFQGFASATIFNTALGEFRRRVQTANNRILTAFVPIGITETARFITNKNRETRPAEIGVPSDLGATYVNPTTGIPFSVGQFLPTQLGLSSIEEAQNLSVLYNIGGLGSLHSNADIAVYGTVNLFANATLGDQFTVAGNITGADGAQLVVRNRELSSSTSTWNTFTTTLNAGNELESRSNTFTTARGIVRDGLASTDTDGFARGVGYKTPPSIAITDPETNENRYVQMTRESGLAAGSGNSGRFGHGSGIYIDNFADRQSAQTESGRQANGGSSSMVFDWLNPNHPESRYWFGSFYLPPGANIEFRNDGFIISRDGRAPAEERFWRNPAGVSSNSSSIRYRLGPGTDGRIHVVNTFTAGLTSIDGTLSQNDYQLGPAFNGTIYTEGNARVRGVIPTDIQITLVSNASVYVEGSLTKGITGNDWTARNLADPEFTARGARMQRPSRSMLALLARDYVVVNTTMFVGPSPLQPLENGRDASTIRLRQDAGANPLALISEFVLGAGAPADTYNPSAWVSAPVSYRDAITNTQIQTNLLMSHTMEDGAADRSFFSMSVNPGLYDGAIQPPASTYLWPNNESNAAAAILGSAAPTIPINGFGVENWQRYPKFESSAHTLLDPASFNTTGLGLTCTASTGSYQLFPEATNTMVIAPNQLNNLATNDYLLRKIALAPHDIRIEALMYAEEGSFFVIPGTWFNADPNDRRDTYLARLGLLRTGRTEAEARQLADDERRTNFGSSALTPFFGEPLDVRVIVTGAVSENMPPSMSEQSEWIRKWGWIPGKLGATDQNIPASHARSNPGFDGAGNNFASNLIIGYDPVLASGRSDGFANVASEQRILRQDSVGRVLPPLPRLPVSPALAYFGDLN